MFESFFLQGNETGKEKNIAHSLRDDLGDAKHYVCEDEEQCAAQAITLGKQALEKGETLCFLTRSPAHARSLSSFFGGLDFRIIWERCLLFFLFLVFIRFFLLLGF